MPNPLPPETTPEWTADDERELQRNAALSDPWCLDQSMVFFIRRYARQIIRLRSENERQITAAHETAAMWYHEAESLRSELSRSRSVPEPGSQFVGCDEKENDCTGCDGSGRLECGASVVRSEIPEPGTGKWYSQGYVDDLNARLAATQTANAAASVPNTGTALSEEERRDISELEGIRDGLRRSAIHKRDGARATPDEYLHNTWHDKADEHDRQADFWTRIIDRLSSAPSRGSEQ